MAHTHVYGEHPNKAWKHDSVACTVCGFRIPKSVLPLAIEQGALVACGHEDEKIAKKLPGMNPAELRAIVAHPAFAKGCRHPECITYRSTP